MIKCKKHLENICRTRLELISRQGYLRLDLNENVDGLPEKFVQETLQSLDSDYLAAYPSGCKTLIEKIAAFEQIDQNNICLTNGSDCVIKYIFESYVSTGDVVLFTDPTFAMYQVYSKMFDAQAISVPYGPDFTLPWEKFLSQINDKTRIAVLINPNNPTGTIIEQQKLKNFIEKCSENGTLAVIDEAYFHFSGQTVIKWVARFSNLIVIRTFSKLLGLAALRIGYAAASGDIINNLIKVKPTFDVNGVAVRFAERLIDNPHIIDEQVQKFREGKEYLKNELNRIGVDFKSGYVNCVLIHCPEKQEEVITNLKHKNILVQGGHGHPLFKDYIRVSVGSKQSMAKFIEAFEDEYHSL